MQLSSATILLASTPGAHALVGSISGNQQKAKLTRSGADEQSWLNTYTNCEKELAPTELPDLDLPSDFPVGTYFRNGHGCFVAKDGQKCKHMFDGDGLVSAITFTKDKRAIFRNRFVRTKGYVKDLESGKMSMRGLFGTMRSGGIFANMFRLNYKNPANTNVIYHANRLLALWEGGVPHELDPVTLETLSEEPDLCSAGVVGDGRYAAHPRYDPVTGNIASFANTSSPQDNKSKVYLFEMDANGNSIVGNQECSFIFEGIGLIHDFMLTENYMIFVLADAQINQTAGLNALLGRGAFAAAVDIDNEQPHSKVILVPRINKLVLASEGKSCAEMPIDGEDPRIKIINVPYHFNFHFSNAFENEQGNIVFDTVQTKTMELGFDLMEEGKALWEAIDWDQIYPTSLQRYVIDPKAGCMASEPTTLCTQVPEFPSIPRSLSTQKHRYVYSVGSHQELETNSASDMGSGPAGSILKIDCEDPNKNEAFSFQPHEFVNEPVFCAKNNDSNSLKEDSGYLIVYVVDGRRRSTDLCIFDVEGKDALSRGPVVRTTMPTFLPGGLHGMFAEDMTFDF